MNARSLDCRRDLRELDRREWQWLREPTGMGRPLGGEQHERHRWDVALFTAQTRPECHFNEGFDFARIRQGCVRLLATLPSQLELPREVTPDPWSRHVRRCVANLSHRSPA